MTNLIAAAVAPLKPIQMDRAEQMVRRSYEVVAEDIAKGDGTMKGTIAAIAAEYEAKGWKYWPDSQKADMRRISQFFRTDYATGKLVEQTTALHWLVKQARQAASDSYDAYVAKMIAKIGDVTEATMQTSSNVWGYSVLEVTTVAGERQIWTTQQIVNRSVHGKLFNQWPSRLAASKASQKKAMKALAA